MELSKANGAVGGSRKVLVKPLRLIPSFDTAKNDKALDKSNSTISDLSESPYKSMNEKELFFKILDKHQEAMSDRKKRLQYQHR